MERDRLHAQVTKDGDLNKITTKEVSLLGLPLGELIPGFIDS